MSLDSDKAICVRIESPDGQKVVQVVSLATGVVTNKFPMGAESAILCPDGRSIAVRAGGALQIFNMELQKKVKSHKMPDADVPVFWNWASPTTIGIVTASSVYHWSSDGESAPVKMFDRDAKLAGTQIISYALSPDQQWMMVAGIKAGAVPGGPAEGCMQLYSAEKKVSQPLSAHAGCFATVKPHGRADVAVVFAFVKYGGAQPELTIIEIGRDRNATGAPFRPAPAALPMPGDAAADFPVAVQASKKLDMIYVLTKMGYAYVFDLHSCSALARHRVSETPVFCSISHEASGGVVAVAAKTGVVSLVSINEQLLVTYIVNQLRKPELAMSIAGRLGLAGADELYIQQFNAQLSSGDIDGAIKTAASSSATGVLRSAQTIQRLQQLPVPEGGQPPVLKYFGVLMETTKLNKAESIEISRPALSQGKVALIERWLSEDKITCSEALGDMVMQTGNPKLALSVYFRSGEAHDKVIQALLQAGEFTKIVPYALKYNVSTNFVFILAQLSQANPKAAEEFAKQLVKEPQSMGRPPLMEIPDIIQVFQGTQKLQECTAFLLDVLAEDKPEQGFLQTKALELNLLGGAPQVAHAILGSGIFHHFDKAKIAALCERAQLYQRALELYSEVKDIKRVLMQSQQLDPQFVIAFFANHPAETVVECLGEMLKNAANEALVVKVATQYSEQLTPEELIKLFETAKMGTGLYYYLGSIVNSSENKAVHYKYIVAAANLKQFKEVERVCRDSTVYDPAAVRDFLIDAKLADPRPLIHVCDRFGFVDDLTNYLWNNKLAKFIEVYVQKVAPAKTPQVVGKLLDLDADEETIKGLIDSVRMLCPVDGLVEEVEKRNRLRLLLPWLESRLRDGAIDPGTHNALGKIYVTVNKDPQNWLKSNLYYDSKVVGKFCEKLDPYLAYLAYRRANGACDAELIEVTNKNGLFKDQARYLVERQDLALWENVLIDENPHRRDLIDQVTSTALPETKNADEVSTTVKAFMAAKLPNELIGLLEKLVLSGGEFHNNRNLQNLLILTAVKTAHEPSAPEGRAMDYILRLDAYDGKEIAKIALRDEYQLFEEAFAIYKKFNHHVEAIEVLLDRKGDLERASEYSQRVNEKDCWNKLAAAQLAATMVKDAVDSYIKSNDASNYENVIRVAEREAKFDDLVRYLEMARKSVKERQIDSSLVYALAQTMKLAELESFISSPNVADIQAIGDRCFEETLFEAARIVYTAANNYPKLASTLVALGLYREAVDAGKKANSVRTWKEVSAACVRAGEFKLAQACGLHIIVSPDHMEDLIASYESEGHWEQLIALLEQGAVLEAAHQGIFTELCVMYSRYRPEKLNDSIKMYHKRLNISKVIRACEAGRHWPECVFLLCDVELPDYDQGVRVMIDHAPHAFTLDKFLEVVPKVRNAELHYSALTFFLEEEPSHLARLLTVLSPKLDHSRVVHQFRKTDALSLIFPYLKAVQPANIIAVNEAVNQLCVDEEDVEALRGSIESYDQFDQVALAQRLEKHELLEFRRVAALLYTRNKRFEAAIALSKKDAQYKDAIDAAAESGEQALAESLLNFFVVDVKDNAAFTACLYSCYAIIRADVAMELAWRHRLMDFAMPFMIQFMRDTTQKIAVLEARTAPKEDAAAAAAAAAAASDEANPMLMGGQGGMNQMLALTDGSVGSGAFVGGVPIMGGMGLGGMGGAGGFGGMPTMGGASFGGGLPQMNGFSGQSFGGGMGGFPPQY